MTVISFVMHGVQGGWPSRAGWVAAGNKMPPSKTSQVKRALARPQCFRNNTNRKHSTRPPAPSVIHNILSPAATQPARLGHPANQTSIIPIYICHGLNESTKNAP